MMFGSEKGMRKDIERAKAKLAKLKANRDLRWDSGQNEVRRLRDKYGFDKLTEPIADFSQWVRNLYKEEII